MLSYLQTPPTHYYIESSGRAAYMETHESQFPGTKKNSLPAVGHKESKAILELASGLPTTWDRQLLELDVFFFVQISSRWTKGSWPSRCLGSLRILVLHSSIKWDVDRYWRSL